MGMREEAQGTKANAVKQGAQDDSATELLMRIAVQLEQQTAELKQIRRSAATCNRQLSAVHLCMQQLLHLFALVTEACCKIATTLSEMLHRTAAADKAVRLQVAISNGRLIMLLLMLLLSACTSCRVVHAKCAAQLTPSGRMPALLRPLAFLFLPRTPAQQKQSSLTGYLKSSYPGCMLTATGRHLAGLFVLVLYTLWSWRKRAAAATTGQQASSSTALIAAADPLVSMLLTSLPVSAGSLSLLSVALQPALYEAVIGGMVVALLSGRVAAWLLLWELWLLSSYCNCRKLNTATPAALQGSYQQAQQHMYPVIYPCLHGTDSKQRSSCTHDSNTQRVGGPGQSVQDSSSSGRQYQLVKGSTASGCQSVKLWIIVTAAQLLLPVVMPLVTLWR